jgi:AcrR family transcriptional regulator
MPARTPRQQRGVARRMAVLEAAGRAFDRTGYAGAALADIARDAGSTLGGLAFYFPHKQDLARAVIDEQNARTFASLAGATVDRGPVAAMVQASQVIADQLLTDPLVRGGIRLSMELGGLTEPTHAFYDEWMEQVTGLFTAAQAGGELVDGIDPRDLAETSVAYFTGVHTVGAVLTERADLYHRLLVMWRLIITGTVAPSRRDEALAFAEQTFSGTQPTPVPVAPPPGTARR